MEDGELKCDTCGHLSSNILDYADHAVDVHLMQFILCPKCPIDDDSILYKKKNLLKHDKSDHGKFFLCVLCKKEVNVSNYRKHQYEHIQKSKVAFCAWYVSNHLMYLRVKLL